MKRVRFDSLPLGARFNLDFQWWEKVDHKTARHTTNGLQIDLMCHQAVMVRGEETQPVTAEKAEKKKQSPWPGFWLVVGTIIESFKWG